MGGGNIYFALGYLYSVPKALEGALMSHNKKLQRIKFRCTQLVR